MEKKTVISVKNLIARYVDDLILDDISFDVYEGEIFVILGGSGCGKTTLLRHMIGLNIPFSGKVLIDGTDITSCSDKEYQKALRKIGVLFQGSALIGSMSIADNIALPITKYSNLSQRVIDTLVRMKLCLVDLDGYADYMPSELSEGMKKRAGLARALVLNPKILFLDEPSAGLDPVTAAEIDELILHINRSIGTTMIIITHQLDSIYKVAQRLIMLDKRKKGIIAEGDPEFLRNNTKDPFVKQFFNRQARPQLQAHNG